MKFTRGPGRVASLRKSTSLLIFLVAFVLLILYYIVKSSSTSRSSLEYFTEKEPVYCVMITKDSRVNYALHAVKNFLTQDYDNAKLIIISESKIEDRSLNDDRILQVPVRRDGETAPTLGELRNIALEFVPLGGLWTVWDDDDIRSTGYLSSMKHFLGKKDYVFITKRIEYNLNTGYSWVMQLKPGFVLFFGRKRPSIRYDEVNVNEDVRLRDHIKSSFKTVVVDNDPRMYIRTVHDDNTSILVNKLKKNIKDTSRNMIYFESEINDAELEYTREKIATLNTFLNRK